MTETSSDPKVKTAQRRALHRKLNALGWGLFFIWIGIAILADVGWGIGLIGIGVIILGLRATGEYIAGSIYSGQSKALC